ncbi:hypothetical protein AGMMS49587_04120 [Spirochaetia bacterium]|nr:hypothetical protein AGMMS49587_04120 [Spirochaetia bacterium]
MDKKFSFERNLLALSVSDPELCSRLSGAETTLNRYRLLESRSGKIIPAIVDANGAAHPLHSLVDPRREGERLVSTLKDEEFLIFLGMGGAFAIEAALERRETGRVLIIEYDINGVAELLCSREYVTLFGDPRVNLLVDPPPELLEQYILENYQPALSGGIRVLPLRTRTEFSQGSFNRAGEAIQNALDRLSADYSVQAYFGTRWFSNIIRNLKRAEEQNGPVPPIRRGGNGLRHAAIIAAGPSLDAQLPLLAEQRSSLYLIAADTSLPALLHRGLEPDAVISIDCQHISYYHFMWGLPGHIPLFLDLASPPLVASRAARPRFFSGGHPLTNYISQVWRPIPQVDTSGANVTYAALSLAESLGADRIDLYGADFSYPRGQVYARGAYIFPFFEKQQNRLAPMEALFSAFLYRSPLSKLGDENSWYYEMATLRRYRERLEEKLITVNAEVHPIPGMGAPITVRRPPEQSGRRDLRIFSSGPARMSSGDFLAEYREGIRSLRPMKSDLNTYLRSLDDGERLILATLLPQAAAIRRRENGLAPAEHPAKKPAEIIERVREYCVDEIDRITT